MCCFIVSRASKRTPRPRTTETGWTVSELTDSEQSIALSLARLVFEPNQMTSVLSLFSCKRRDACTTSLTQLVSRLRTTGTCSTVMQLCIIGVEMRSHVVTFGQVGDILGVCRKLYRDEDGALGHTAVYGEALRLLPMSSIAQVWPEPVKGNISNTKVVVKDWQKYVVVHRVESATQIK